jgi:beta-glucanase (GH16 family)
MAIVTNRKIRFRLYTGIFIVFIITLYAAILAYSEMPQGDFVYSGYIDTDFQYNDQSIKAGFKVEILELGKYSLTDSKGYFTIPFVPLNTGETEYTVKITKKGFMTRILSSLAPDTSIEMGTKTAPVVMWAGDMNHDGAINIADILEIAKSFNSAYGDLRYVEVNDINKDNACNITDIMIVVNHFNKSGQDYPYMPYVTHSATPTSLSTPTPHNAVNLIKNGDFSNGVTGWTLWCETETGASASNTVVNGENKTVIVSPGQNPWSVHIYQGTFGIVEGKVYELSFYARSTVNRSIRPTVENTAYTQYFYNVVPVNSTMTKYTYRFVASASDESARVVFSMGNVDGLTMVSHEVYLDNITLTELDSSQFSPTPVPTAYPTDPMGWRLTWSDEFDGINGSKPDSTKWVYDIGGTGWGNNELQYYTDSAKNAYQENGRLVIKAIKENVGGRNYTSARIKTKGRFEQAYGKFEARIKIPYGQGIWPAFWMLGKDVDDTVWPGCGEIDIMENIGREPEIIHGTIHGPGYSADRGPTSSYTGIRFADDYHVYAIEWEPNVIRWYCDGKLYGTKTSNDIGTGNKWVFDHPFFMILNVAVGGGWPGNPDATTVFPQTMEIDYVRVYQR